MVTARFLLGSALAISPVLGQPLYSNQSSVSASTLIENGLKAMGGETAIAAIRAVTYHVPEIYRTNSLMEAFTLQGADTSIATAGHQNISFSYTDPNLRQRIDRFHYLSQTWGFANPSLLPMDYSLTVQGGKDGWACYVKSNNYIFEPRTVTDGYTDGNVAAYHIFQAQKLSPLLLASIKSNNNSVAINAEVQGGQFLPAVHDNTLNITVIFDPTTSLPRYIRSYEVNHVFGPSTSDLQVYNYTEVEGVMFPRNIKELYNRDSGSVLQDFFIYEIEVNPTIVPSFFDGLSGNQTQSTPSAPIIEFDYGFAEIGEWDSNMLWGGKYKGKSSNVSATHPIPTVPQLWHITFLDTKSYTQIVMEFEDAVIVGEAPAHQSQQVIQWVRDTLGKNITHIWSTHHHHDHSYGTRDYIAAGAKAIVIDTAVNYWSNIPGIEFITYSASEPYIHRDANIEARFLSVFDKQHAEDMSYAFISAPCPGPNDTVAIFEADLWNPGLTDYRFDQEQALVLLDQAAKDGVSRNAVVIPVHGVEAPLEGLIDATDYNYPNYTAVDFRAGGKLCTGD